jgi:phosphoribosylaminoimidazolecarboxamide formyltransferase/IMP cyclohydrolase
MSTPVRSALISVFSKDGLEPLVRQLQKQQVTFYSTGGTQNFLEQLGVEVVPVDKLTDYPSVFGGRVKTLHPKVFGGILQRRNNASDKQEAEQHAIPTIDLVVVDLYPFGDTVASGTAEQDIIEKIDIGGVSLLRAAAKNFADVAVVSAKSQYQQLADDLAAGNGALTLEQRKTLAAKAFALTAHYDTAISNWFAGEQETLTISHSPKKELRYGENPHQKGYFYGDLEGFFNQLHGKELSYNNLVDVDAAVNLMAEFPAADGPAFAILKHTNACGAATGATCAEAYKRALAADPVSAFGGVLISNTEVDFEAAEEIHKLFVEVLIAPSFTDDALRVLKQKKNRVLLVQKGERNNNMRYKSLLNGMIGQQADAATETAADLTTVTKRTPNEQEQKALLFANKLAKHTKSNTIVLANEGQLLASGVGQTSRIDALKQAIEKAHNFGFKLEGAVMASDAFFPFPDCVEVASQAGITAVIQPGGSKRDQESIDYCDANNMAMVTTGVRHFLH